MHLNLLNRLAKATSSTCCFIRVLVVFGCSIPTVSVAHAQVIPDQLEFLRSAHVRVVVDGDTLILTDGSVVRLVGIMAPRLPFGREEIPQQPFAQEARDALDALVWDQKIDLYIGGTSPDRHGRILAHVFTQDGTCVQAELLDRRIYLNFGDDWRQDTTVTVSPNNRSIFADADVDFAALEGKKIRVRGWTQWYNGPVIEIDHPEQIEVLEQ